MSDMLDYCSCNVCNISAVYDSSLDVVPKNNCQRNNCQYIFRNPQRDCKIKEFKSDEISENKRAVYY